MNYDVPPRDKVSYNFLFKYQTFYLVGIFNINVCYCTSLNTIFRKPEFDSEILSQGEVLENWERFNFQ